MIKSNFKKAAVIGMCCTMISSGAVSAMPRDIASNRILPSIEIGIESHLLEKQKEIDQYVFVTHVEEIAEAGFTVTHTGPRENYVEVGILPYDETNANYLYQLFGKEQVSVVEGIQAVTLPIDQLPYQSNVVIEDRGVEIQVNGRKIQTSVKPFIQENRTLIPLRGVMEELGAKVEWHPEERIVKVLTEDVNIELAVGENTAKIVKNINGTYKEETLKLEVPAKIVEGRTFIPGRFVTESLGAKVEWDSVLRIMKIKTNANMDIPSVEKIIDFEIVASEIIEENKLVSKWYQDNLATEGIYSLTDGEWKYILVAAGEKPTGGYNLQIDSITEVIPKTAYVYATLRYPDKGDFVTQALTYPHAVVRFHKGDIEKVQGDLVELQQDGDDIIQDEIGESLEEMGKMIPIDSIQEMKLYSLMQEEIKTFTAEEIDEIVNQLNTSPTYNGAYILMLAGNNIRITLEGGDSIQLTSYGFKDHVIMAGEVDGKHISYCIVSPEVGSILLSNIDL
ncbi:copper amine oxidase domain-containing protein [Clostridium aceticum]|uniref:Copper amine oxidase domain-containing protein n=1 Tax=Clostridium aceticum TaxID=84022 RepID=A0A0G3WBL3_9CLOT|nr:stalk domain-containing protein [Clostridium aceticum]AKL96006.1 copper amine oxidase domain-containing protein [Clostridium aceticum]